MKRSLWYLISGACIGIMMMCLFQVGKDEHAA